MESARFAVVVALLVAIVTAHTTQDKGRRSQVLDQRDAVRCRGKYTSFRDCKRRCQLGQKTSEVNAVVQGLRFCRKRSSGYGSARYTCCQHSKKSARIIKNDCRKRSSKKQCVSTPKCNYCRFASGKSQCIGAEEYSHYQKTNKGVLDCTFGSKKEKWTTPSTNNGRGNAHLHPGCHSHTQLGACQKEKQGSGCQWCTHPQTQATKCSLYRIDGWRCRNAKEAGPVSANAGIKIKIRACDESQGSMSRVIESPRPNSHWQCLAIDRNEKTATAVTGQVKKPWIIKKTQAQRRVWAKSTLHLHGDFSYASWVLCRLYVGKSAEDKRFAFQIRPQDLVKGYGNAYAPLAYSRETKLVVQTAAKKAGGTALINVAGSTDFQCKVSMEVLK